MTEVWVGGDTHNSGVDGLEVSDTVTEGNDLRGTHKGAATQQQGGLL